MHQTINTELAGKPGFKKFRVKLDDFECTVWAADSVDAQRDARASANIKEVKLPECEEVPADWEFPKEDKPADLNRALPENQDTGMTFGKDGKELSATHSDADAKSAADKADAKADAAQIKHDTKHTKHR